MFFAFIFLYMFNYFFLNKARKIFLVHIKKTSFIIFIVLVLYLSLSVNYLINQSVKISIWSWSIFDLSTIILYIIFKKIVYLLVFYFIDLIWIFHFSLLWIRLIINIYIYNYIQNDQWGYINICIKKVR